MALAAGTRLGPYEIVAPIGAGGMGEVYRARDTRLERTVAIKVLLPQASGAPEARARFEREARAIAALDHPHICAVYDIGHDAGVDFIVMQCLEGETLASRLEKGALPLDQVIRCATEIADALHNAHRQGVVHRDLKPGNIMLTKDGARLLDFGLARLQAAGGPISGMSNVATEAPSLTAAGMILGTLQYMAPEQLEGKDADARTDIFALGSLIYEMATGCKAFEGGSQASVITAIMSMDPQPIATLQPLTPPALEHLVVVCLAKDPNERWQSARDVERELRWVATVRAEPLLGPYHSRSRWRALAIAGVTGLALGAVAAGAAAWMAAPSGVAQSGVVSRSTIPLTSATTGGSYFVRTIAMSPDGRYVAFSGEDATGPRLYLRPLDAFTSTAIAGTDGAGVPFFSPDSRWIGYFDRLDNKLKKVAVTGGAPQAICDTDGLLSATWGDDRTIVFVRNAGTGLLRVSAEGGAPRELTTPDRNAREKSHRSAEFLPGGRAVLFTVGTADITSFDDARIEAVTLGTGERKVLVRGGMYARYVPTGHLLYARAGSLLAVPFDVERLDVTGPPVTLIDNVLTNSGNGYAGFATSSAGTLVYMPGGATDGARSLVWVDRRGATTPALEVRRPFLFIPRLASGGRRVAITQDTATAEVWVYELERTTGARVVYGWDNTNAVWTAGETRIVFNSNRGVPGTWNLFSQAIDGNAPAQQLTSVAGVTDVPQSLSGDGRTLVFTRQDASGNADIWTMNLADNSARPLVETAAIEANARVSPDGKWIAYQSNESGVFEVFVQAFPTGTRRWQVSLGGGAAPEWAPDGRELFYRNGRQMIAVRFSAQAAPLLSRPQPLFAGSYQESSPWIGSAYTVARDGRFLMIAIDRRPITHLNLVQNWPEELKSRVGR